MKKLSLYQIRDLALESGRSVFSMQQLSNLIGQSRAVCTVYASRLVKKNLAIRLRKGMISFESDDFIISSQLVEPSYISLSSALRLHGIINQIQKNIECVTPKNSFKFEDLGIVYHKISPSLFFGFKKHQKGKSYVMIAEIEKALIDGVYLNIFNENDLKEFSKKVDRKKLFELINRYAGRSKIKMNKVFSNALKS